MAKIVSITNPAELLLAQIEEVRNGNSQTRNEIERLRRLLKGGEREVARMEIELDKLLLSHVSEEPERLGSYNHDECCHFQD